MKIKKYWLRSLLAKIIQMIRYYLLAIKGYDIHKTVIIERNLNLDRLYPKGIHIGANTLVASRVTILSHDHCKRVNGQPLLNDVYIGQNCFIAVGAIIMPGVKIGNEVIIGAGSVVTKDIPSNSVAVGNPAKVIKSGIKMNAKAEWSNWPGIQ